jgi:hypothetical protein
MVMPTSSGRCLQRSGPTAPQKWKDRGRPGLAEIRARRPCLRDTAPLRGTSPLVPAPHRPEEEARSRVAALRPERARLEGAHAGSRARFVPTWTAADSDGRGESNVLMASRPRTRPAPEDSVPFDFLRRAARTSTRQRPLQRPTPSPRRGAPASVFGSTSPTSWTTNGWSRRFSTATRRSTRLS